jgi:hypothetical protein
MFKFQCISLGEGLVRSLDMKRQRGRLLYISASILLLVLMPCTIKAEEQDQAAFSEKLFLEIWNDNSYRRTEFGTDEPDYSEEDFYISQLWVQTGARFDVMENVFFNTHFVFELVGDWGSEEWNDVYWNNMQVWGAGGRLSYEISPDPVDGQFLWVSDFNVELFADLLFSESTLDGANEEIPKEDLSNNVRTGISVWTALDSRDFFSGGMSLWAEIWGEFAYESTGFAEDYADNYYLFTIESLVGPQFPFGEISLQPYYAIDIIRDFGNEQWNKEPWLNNITYGPGIRLSLGSLLPVEQADLYLYAEYVNIDYFSRVESELYENTADDDVRFGIEIYLPFGATQDRIIRH